MNENNKQAEPLHEGGYQPTGSKQPMKPPPQYPSGKQAEPVATDVGNLEYMGNSVSFIYQKMRAYKDGMGKVWQALRDNGIHPDGQTHAADAIRRALAHPPQPVQPAVAQGWVLQRVMGRLADLLDEDQFAEIEGMIVRAGIAPPDSAPPAGAQGEPMAHYGIVDPDYARVFTQARCIAWQYGYTCVMHGSFTRDLDLLMVPWTEQAKDNREQMLKLIAMACELRFSDGKEDVIQSKADFTQQPHGRTSCSLHFPSFGDRRWIDVSFFPVKEASTAAINEQLLEALKLADAALEGAHMNADVVYKKVKAAIEQAEAEKAKGGAA